MSTSDRLLHLQARMQAQVLRENLRGLYGLLLRSTSCGDHEQTILVYTWRAQPGITYLGGSQECKFFNCKMNAHTEIVRLIDSANRQPMV